MYLQKIKWALFPLVLLLTGCFSSVGPEPQGNALFWTKSKALGGSYLEIYVYDATGYIYHGRIKETRDTLLNCNESGALRVALPARDLGYRYKAVGQNGWETSGDVSITKDNCSFVEIRQ